MRNILNLVRRADERHGNGLAVLYSTNLLRVATILCLVVPGLAASADRVLTNGRIFTADTAQLGFQGDPDSIEVGKLADLVVLDRNIFEALPRSIVSARPAAVLLEDGLVSGTLGTD